MRSMTGYGRYEVKNSKMSLTVEIRTVNNRFLDLSFKCPRSFIPLQDGMRSAINKHVIRGKADVFVNYTKLSGSSNALTIDNELASSYVQVAKTLKKSFPSLKNDFTVTSLMKTADVLSFTEEEVSVEEISAELLSAVENACINLNEMRTFEGEKLKCDLLVRVQTIEDTVLKIKERAPLVAKEYQARLLERVQTLMQNEPVDQSRLLQEVAVFADKSNIDEELTRLTSHIAQFRNICEEQGEVGKKLDFLIQEFNREANTVCSKSNDIAVTDNALKLKCEIEKIREQIQNIE